MSSLPSPYRHVDDVARLSDLVLLDEGEAVAHGQEVANLDQVARILTPHSIPVPARAHRDPRAPSSTNVPTIMWRTDLAVDHERS